MTKYLDFARVFSFANFRKNVQIFVVFVSLFYKLSYYAGIKFHEFDKMREIRDILYPRNLIPLSL